MPANNWRSYCVALESIRWRLNLGLTMKKFPR